MAGPSLEGFKPSRELYKDYSTEANIYNDTLGDTPLSPLMNIAKGIESGIDLGNKANEFIYNNSPDGVEKRRIELETARARAESLRNAAMQSTIQAKHAAILDQITLQKEQLDLKNEIYTGERVAKQQAILDEAITGISQIQDAESLSVYLRDPRYALLRSDPTFGNMVRSQATALLHTATPEEQIRLVQTAEAVAPGSADKLKDSLSSEVQGMMSDPNRGVRGGGARQNAQTIKEGKTREQDAFFVKDSLSKVNKMAKPGYVFKGTEVNSGTGDDAGEEAGQFIVFQHPQTGDKQKIPVSALMYGAPTQQAKQQFLLDRALSELDKKQSSSPEQAMSEQPQVFGDPSKNRVSLNKRQIDTKAALGIDYENDVADPYVQKIDAIVSTATSTDSGYGDREKSTVEKLADQVVKAEGLTGPAASNRKRGIIEGAYRMYKDNLRRKKFADELKNKIPVTGMTSPTPPVSPTPIPETSQAPGRAISVSGAPTPNTSPIPGL